MPESFQTLSPIDGRVYVERPFASDAEIEGALSRARRALAGWRRTPLAERIVLLRAMTEHLLGQKEALAEELTRQMGRPLSQTPWEIAGYAARASAMLDLAPTALADIELAEQPGFVRDRRCPSSAQLNDFICGHSGLANVVSAEAFEGSTGILDVPFW